MAGLATETYGSGGEGFCVKTVRWSIAYACPLSNRVRFPPSIERSRIRPVNAPCVILEMLFVLQPHSTDLALDPVPEAGQREGASAIMLQIRRH